LLIVRRGAVAIDFMRFAAHDISPSLESAESAYYSITVALPNSSQGCVLVHADVLTDGLMWSPGARREAVAVALTARFDGVSAARVRRDLTPADPRVRIQELPAL
jgi:hypothetical protein